MPAMKNKSEVFLRLWSNMIGNADDKTNFPHALLLIIDKWEISVKLIQIIYQLTWSYWKLNYKRWYNQGDFLVDFLDYC